ncbi:MAG: xylulokinase [Rhodobacteraceae bacterium]|nr:xylulokinase [Paracoccaceae bacterium]
MYVGLDLGTSGLRALLVDGGGQMLGEAETAFGTMHPRPGWSEQAPKSWIEACRIVMSGLERDHPGAVESVRGIGISGHMHGATLLDEDGVALRPCILWNDTRSSEEAARLDAIPRMREITGNIVFPGFTAPKLEWVRLHEPEIFRRTARVLLPKDFLRLWLTGEYFSDMSDSAGTSWLDVGSRAWSDEALKLTHMRRDQMPELREGVDRGGNLRRSLCREWGIAGPVCIAGGAGDNAAAACGVGCLAEGTGFVSLGTSGVVLAARDSFSPSPETAVHTFCHAVPGRWYQMGVMLAATDCLNWLSRVSGRSPAQLAESLPDRIDGPSSLAFLPYLSGERTPHNDATIRGVFAGIDVSMDTESLTRAVMEGVAFALRDCIEALRSTGARLETTLAVGGGSRSRFWLETISTILGVTLSLPKGQDLGAALGAARLAICADTGADPGDVMVTPEIRETIHPRAELVEAYEAGYRRFRSLYGSAQPGPAA